MPESVAVIFQRYGMDPPKPWTNKKPLYVPKWDCFSIRRLSEDTYVCGCLDRLYCKYENCKFYKPRGESYEKRNNEEWEY